MLQLRERFTQVRLGDIMGLKSVHAMRIYELTKQYQLIGERTIKIAELRECCGVSGEQYKRFNDFKKDVLERSKKEINAKTDLLVDYEEIKTSRKITDIKFIIKKNPDYGLTEFEKAQRTKSTIITKEMRSANAIIEQIIEYGFSRAMAKKFMQQGTEDEINDALKAVNIQMDRGRVKNPKAMLQNAIKEKWKPEVYKARKNRPLK